MFSSECLSCCYQKRLFYYWRSVRPGYGCCTSIAAYQTVELAVLIDDRNAHHPPSAEALAEWNMAREASVTAQIIAAEAEKASEKATKHSTSEEAIRKRKEREAKKAAAAQAKALAEGLTLDDSSTAPVLPVPVVEDRPGTPSKNAAHAFTVTIPASSSDLQWYTPDSAAYSTLDSAREVSIWTYPTTPFEYAKCRVFQDLWEKGNYMGGGIKFGGDFLVYPGMSHCVQAQSCRLLTSLQVIRCGTTRTSLRQSSSRPTRL